MRKYHVSTICNALIDILIQVEESDLKTLGLTKGVMHLVESERQREILSYFQNKEKTHELGGSSLNAIRTLASLGMKTFFAGMVGKDEFSHQILNRMKLLGIDNKILNHQEPTGSCVVLITPDGERTMNTHLGASRLFTESLVPADEITRSKVFHFCGYQWDTDGQKGAIQQAINLAKESGTLVSFDLADPFVVKRFREKFIELIDLVDIVFANEEEAKILFECAPAEVVNRITAAGSVAVVKLGARGAIVGEKDRRIKVSPVPTQVVDTTAAGDMFASGFLYGICNGLALEKCGQIAATLASDVISRIGATVSAPALDKVKQV
ncbi:MAG: adenosine kinase [Oligoflexales bacterium]